VLIAETRSSPPAWVRVAAAVIPALPAARYRLIDRLCRRAPTPFWMELPADAGGYAYECDLKDAIVREVCFTGRYEPQETALLRALLRPGMTFADVGANWGYFTLLGAHLVGPRGRVLAVEADPRMFATLARNIARNALPHVTALHAAVADRACTVTLAGYRDGDDKRGLSKLVETVPAGSPTFRVAAQPLDAACDRLGIVACDVVKMDVEGAELLALVGMAEGLRAGRYRRILIELHPTMLAERGTDIAAVVGALGDNGYRGWWIDHSPTITRRVAYARRPRVTGLLTPFDPAAPGLWRRDAWPHMLWLAPSVAGP
jgi:FkbM family methyltransferase